ncbi:DNA polymerase [Caudoviricetes sp.]|nr:DNA polymerase [Caudoviricetes sp.]
MKVLILDVESTTSNKGNPFDETNKLCLVGLSGESGVSVFDIDYTDTPNVDALQQIQREIDSHDLLVGFNIKFDLHWLRNYGLQFSTKRIWDCQLVDFILGGQSNPYPSLDGVASSFGINGKLDTVAGLWEQGIDTCEIPYDILKEYLEQDLAVTKEVYLKQKELVEARPQEFQRLISLHNQDIIVLQEMEYNGIRFDEAKCKEFSVQLEGELKDIDEHLFGYHSIPGFNPNSTDHLSAFLYGGTITIPRRQVVGTFKSGARKGLPKEAWVNDVYTLPGIVKPIRGSELKKEGYYSTDDATLKQLTAKGKSKEILELVLQRALLEKRKGTYYDGFPKLRETMNWEESTLHGQLNQCVVVTGRLSSSRPNLQNIDKNIKQLFGSRYII